MDDRKKLVGNWKMNLRLNSAQSLATEIIASCYSELSTHPPVIFAAPFPFIHAVYHLIKDKQNIHVAAQNTNENTEGAFTGEIAAQMIASVGAKYCIVGHSERRKYYNDTNEICAKKINQLISNNISPIYCIGETKEQRENNETLQVIENQLSEGCFHTNINEFAHIIIAYEPVWAIGTNLAATPLQAQEVHAFIRNCIEKKYDNKVANACSILYGGSLNDKNAKDIFEQPDIDGGLIGGASLVSRSFINILKVLKESPLKQ